MLITIQLLLRLNVYNDQAEAMKALDGKKIFALPTQAGFSEPLPNLLKSKLLLKELHACKPASMLSSYIGVPCYLWTYTLTLSGLADGISIVRWWNMKKLFLLSYLCFSWILKVLLSRLLFLSFLYDRRRHSSSFERNSFDLKVFVWCKDPTSLR